MRIWHSVSWILAIGMLIGPEVSVQADTIRRQVQVIIQIPERPAPPARDSHASSSQTPAASDPMTPPPGTTFTTAIQDGNLTLIQHTKIFE